MTDYIIGCDMPDHSDQNHHFPACHMTVFESLNPIACVGVMGAFVCNKLKIDVALNELSDRPELAVKHARHCTSACEPGLYEIGVCI